MKSRYRMFQIMVLIMIVPYVSGCMTAGKGVPGASFERVADSRRMMFPELLADLRLSRLIFIGEIHNIQAHHQLQLDVIQGLQHSGVNVAIAFEMFRAENQQSLDWWVNGRLGVLEFMAMYRANWTLPWETYDSIFLYARNNSIPMIALNAPVQVMQKVYRQGFKALSPEERALLPPEVSCSVDRPYMDFVRRNFIWHSTDESAFIYFCEAQLLRNKVMARHIVNFLERNPDMTVVVLTGVGHAMRRGIPDEIEELMPVNMKILMPYLEEIAAESLQKGDVDYLTRQW